MEINELPLNVIKQVKVIARKKWNGTGIAVAPGQRFTITSDKGDTWRDFYIVTDADGFTSENLKSYESKKNLPDVPWCALLGQIGPTGSPFLIGSKWSGVMNSSGELGLLPNDATGFYWNNFGSILVSVKRVS